MQAASVNVDFPNRGFMLERVSKRVWHRVCNVPRKYDIWLRVNFSIRDEIRDSIWPDTPI